MQSPLTPLDFARRARKTYAGREAVVDGGFRLTYSQFFSRCDRWSFILQGYGIQKGDRVAYIAPNTHAQLESFYAVPQTGAIIVPINYRLSAEEFVYIINHSGATVLCVHEDYLDVIDTVRSRLPQVQYFIALEGKRDNWIIYEEAIESASESYTKVNIEEDDLISINYTSGTTSRPKGVMITHRNAYMNSISTLVHQRITPDEKYLWTLPMFHANGWTFVWTITACGAAHICLRKIDAALIFELIAKEKISLFCAAPTVLITIVNAPESLRSNAPKGLRLFTAGAPPASATIERIEKELGWELTQVYGLTETSPFITICEPLPEHDTLSIEKRSVIKARQGVELIPAAEVKVVDGNDNEVPQDGTTMGEIVTRGNVVMKGYYRDKDATARSIVNGWFHTGDSAVVHPDGYIEIRDRIKDIIISGGENISSVEIESVLLQHACVLEAAVVGMPDTKWGESPHAFVVLKADHTSTDKELKDHIRKYLASFKVPQTISFVKELPKTATGKIQKYILRGGKPFIAWQ